MPDDVKRPSSKPRRGYRSPVRTEQMQNTRHRAIEAATTLFIERGFSATTVAAIAETAGISPETIYTTLGGKRGVLEKVIDSAVRGPNGVDIDRQAWLDEIAALPTARQRLHGWVAGTCRTLARTSPIHAVIRGAADGEDFAVALRDELLQWRRQLIVEHARRFLDGALRPELTPETAGLRYATLVSPELYHLSVEHLGWTPNALQQWLTGMLEIELLAPDSAATDGTEHNVSIQRA